ncbi:hypothetical protein DRN86_03135, partial [Candidatus Geothermarchaeota archaeon]
ALNCFNCVSSILYGFDKGLTRRLIIPYSFRVPLKSFEKIISSEKAELARELLLPYTRIVNQILEGNEELAQLEIFRYLYKEAMAEFMKGSTYAFVISCLFLCEVECRDLTSIALAKQYNVEEVELRRRLISLG